jgi:elongation factor G
MSNRVIKNVVLVSHASCGKTSLADAIAYYTKIVDEIGSVDNGTSISDYYPDEKERKFSINSSVINIIYKNKTLNIIDTPGYADFIGETIPAIRIADLGILCICGIQGIEVGTEKMWRMLKENKMPTAIFVNKLDKENSDFFKVLESAKKTLGRECLPIQYPKGKEDSFEKGINLLNKEEIESLPDNDKEKALKMREQIIESAVETDDELTEKYLEGKEISEKQIKKALKDAIIDRKIVPVLCGVAVRGISVDVLTEIIMDYFPSSNELSAIKAKKIAQQEEKEEEVMIKRSKDESFSALVFKTISDPYIGQLTSFRVYSGSLQADSSFYNSTKQQKEKISKLYLFVGKEQKEVEKVEEGDIAAVAKLKGTNTSDTLCDEKNPVVFNPIKLPQPVISFSVTPKTRSDEEKISEALSKLTSEDPTFKVKREKQTKELIISGMGDLHLDVIVKRLKKNYGVDVTIGTPKVAYKETVTSKAKAQGKYKKQSGGRGQYGDAWIEIEPLSRGKGFEFMNKIVGGAIPKNYIPTVEKGIKEALEEGVLTNNPMVDIKVTLYDGSYHSVDSSDLAFQIAGAMALRKAAQNAKPILLEPIMEVEVSVPADYTGQISGDLSSKRGRIQGMEPRGQFEVVKADVPLSEMFKYATELRSITHGQGSYSMKFKRYERLPHKLAQQIIEQAKERQD